LAGLLEGSAVTIPSFLWCLLSGWCLRNGLAAVGLRLPDAPAELAGLVLPVACSWSGR
jgi:ESS family glutamate:Na+ symporter